MLDVIVIGGSYAGLSAALQLGRARRRVVVADAGQRRNRAATSAHGFLASDGVSVIGDCPIPIPHSLDPQKAPPPGNQRRGGFVAPTPRLRARDMWDWRSRSDESVSEVRRPRRGSARGWRP
jgi:choline dehydrogenase-like flavoprotein